MGATRGTWLLIFPALLLVAAVLLIPAGVGLARSFTATRGGHTAFVGPANYLALFKERELRVAALNAALYALIAAPLAVAVGLGIAALIARARSREALRLLFLTPWLASPIAVGVLWRFFINNPVGLPNAILGPLGHPLLAGPLANPGLALPLAAGIDAWRISPLAAFLLVPGVLAIPRDLLEQAALDGAPAWRVLRHVWLPALRPLLAVVLLLCLADALGSADTLYTLTHGGPADRTTTLALYSYLRLSVGQDPARGLASAWLAVLLAALLGAGCLWLARARAR